MKKFFKKFFKQRGPDATRSSSGKSAKRVFGSLNQKIPKKLDLNSVQEHSVFFRMGLITLAVLLASAISSRIIGTYFIRPTYTPLPTKKIIPQRPMAPAEDFTAIENRNIFNVENKIPEPFDQGLLDCFSQAKPASNSRLKLLGTIVMTNEDLSVALLEEEGRPTKFAVKKDEVFSDGRYQALKVDRKRFCFQVKQSQELEFIAIPEGNDALLGMKDSRVNEGINKVGEYNYAVKQNYLEQQLKDINNVLQTAKAVPFSMNNKMKGFLIQNIEADSPFASLGLSQGDVLLSANDVVFDNIGKGVEAFQVLRNARRIDLKVLRGGQEIPLTYEVK